MPIDSNNNMKTASNVLSVKNSGNDLHSPVQFVGARVDEEVTLQTLRRHKWKVRLSTTEQNLGGCDIIANTAKNANMEIDCKKIKYAADNTSGHISLSLSALANPDHYICVNDVKNDVPKLYMIQVKDIEQPKLQQYKSGYIISLDDFKMINRQTNGIRMNINKDIAKIGSEALEVSEALSFNDGYTNMDIINETCKALSPHFRAITGLKSDLIAVAFNE